MMAIFLIEVSSFLTCKYKFLHEVFCGGITIHITGHVYPLINYPFIIRTLNFNRNKAVCQSIFTQILTKAKIRVGRGKINRTFPIISGNNIQNGQIIFLDYEPSILLYRKFKSHLWKYGVSGIYSSVSPYQCSIDRNKEAFL